MYLIPETPEQIIEVAREQYGIKKFVGLFSGGKDSLATCHYLWKLGVLNEVLYCNTGINVKENFEYVLKTCNQYGWKLNIVVPKKGETFEDFVRKFDFPHTGNGKHGYIHSAIMGYLKWHPMRKWASEHRSENFAFVSGRRKKESNKRARMSSNKAIERTENMTFISPLYYWSNSKVWHYVKQNSLEKCPVYDTLHISGDCLCGSYAESGEAELLAIFHKDTAMQIAELEHKYGGKWGNASSMRGALKQEQLPKWIEDAVCAECIIDRQKIKTNERKAG